MNKKTIIPKQTENVIDETLTPENAQMKGFHYIDDIFNPYIAIQDVLAFAEEKGYKFGIPGKDGDSDQRFGLYRPIRENNGSE
jgi:hypothetical protein